MGNGKLIVAFVLLSLAISSVPGWCGDGSPSLKEPKQRQPFRVRIEQEIVLAGVRTRGTYDACFDPSTGRFRLEGELRPAEGPLAYSMTMVSDGKIMKQLITSPLGTILCRYDLAAVRKDFPDFDPARAWSPVTYAGLPDTAAPPAPANETLRGEQVRVYTLRAEGGMRLALWHGSALRLPEADNMTLWVSPEDDMVRRVQVRDKEGHPMMSTDYSDFRWGTDVSDQTLSLEIPEDTADVDGTALLKALLRRPGAAREARR